VTVAAVAPAPETADVPRLELSPIADARRPVHRFPLAGQRELRARRAKGLGGRVAVHVTLWD